jgi:DNA repair protein RecO (recombination protein O)
MSTSLRERLYRTEAIILSRRDLGEADRILTIFTPGYGKLNVIAKGSRRTRSRSGPNLDVLARTTIDLAKGRTFDVVTSALGIEMHERLRHDLDAFCAAGYLAELVQHFSQEREEQPALYDLLRRSLAVINEGLDTWLVMRHFELGLLSILGYHPELYSCVNCGEHIRPVVNSWSPVLGGIVGPECGGMATSAMALSVNAQKYIRTIDREGLASLVRLQPSEAERLEVERALGDYVRYVAERDFGSLRVMSMLRSESR